ncbi:CD209 antigen-like protein C isoform X5 [Sparus aurata]|uniref:CD209 antigen-like protein C isoform X5 n=1 Tax=Sparus aurata TaxID=8175 RepID=UPI0011C0FC38|nr:CD209 antigen-like protein C isoform X5 [Sparus aurata]
MSTDIYAKPDLSKKVRYTRKEERQENEVDIYESADDIGIHYFQSHDGGPQNEKQPPAVQRKRFSSAVFCLGVLCFLMLTAIIVLSTCYILDKDQLQTRYNTLTTNQTQLQETVSDITVNNSQLQDEVKKLKDKIEDNNRQFEAKVKQLKDKIKGMTCPDGWTRFGCSCYFRSNQMKTWQQSRTDCQNKGADLVVINNKDENNFVSDLTKLNGESWIGLKTEWSTGRSSYEWKWVDGSPLKETFGASRLQAASWEQYAAYCNRHRQWTDINYGSYKYWICEKEISCTL